MSGLAGAPTGASGVERDDHRYVAYAIFGGLVLLLIVIIAIAVTSLGGDAKPAAGAPAAASGRKLPVYWTVHSGDSYGVIAEKTGLTVDQLESFNPYVDPSAIVPGQRLKLRAKVPQPKPKPLGPKYFTVRSGDSFGSIAAKTGKDITKLMRLNPQIKPSKIQPGDKVLLR